MESTNQKAVFDIAHKFGTEYHNEMHELVSKLCSHAKIDCEATSEMRQAFIVFKMMNDAHVDVCSVLSVLPYRLVNGLDVAKYVGKNAIENCIVIFEGFGTQSFKEFRTAVGRSTMVDNLDAMYIHASKLGYGDKFIEECVYAVTQCPSNMLFCNGNYDHMYEDQFIDEYLLGYELFILVKAGILTERTVLNDDYV